MAAALAELPVWGQNSVPPTAVQAAKMPEFASRLAHAAKHVPPPKSSAFAPAKGHFRPLQGNDIYDNGPINGTVDAWTINFGFVVSDSFPIPAGGATVTGATFGAWLIENDTLESAQLSITSGINGGTSYFNQTVNFTQSGCSLNQYTYDVCTEATSFNVTLAAGTYWVNLQNAVTAEGEPVYWDENSGIGCTSPGCPSSASESEVGTIPSESFTILGNATTTTTSSSTNDYACPSPQPGFHDLRDFSSNAGPSGLAIDTAGKLYGTFANGGSYGAGLLYEFAQRAGHWFLTSLYNFLGGSQGSSPNSVIIGPGGAIFGSAASDLQTCGPYGNYNCGLIYEATPGPAACATALCSWDETTIYQFTGNTDAWQGIVTAYDSAGNLYGISCCGGAAGNGALFELLPAQGGWTETILHSFTGGSDGAHPSSLLMGQDGNLYGTASFGGQYGFGVVFQFVPSGGGWTENVIYAFTGGYEDGFAPGGLIQNEMGGLIGFALCNTMGPSRCYPGGNEVGPVIFALVRSGGGWQFGQISQYRAQVCSGSDFVTYGALALDAAGNLYAVQGGGEYYLCGAVVNITSQTDLVSGRAPIFGNLTSDANGNLYGTTPSCGFVPDKTDGMIWQYSP
jgi:uncharacterized repeat protein (TIGR03803 family)